MVPKPKPQPEPRRPRVEELTETIAALRQRMREPQAENERLRERETAASPVENWLDHPALAGSEPPLGVPDEAEIADREARLERLQRDRNAIIPRRTGPYTPYRPTIRVIGGETDVLKLLGRRGEEPDTPFDLE